jgi:hypothetical protein
MGDDDERCGAKITISFNFRYTVELSVRDQSPLIVQFTRRSSTLGGDCAETVSSVAAAASAAATAGAGDSKRVTADLIAAALTTSLITFLRTDFKRGVHATELAVARCRPGWFKVRLIARALVGTVTAVDGAHNHSMTVQPGAGKHSTHASQVDWAEMSARHAAGSDLISLVNELQKKGVYVEYNHLRFTLAKERKVAFQSEMRHLGYNDADVDMFGTPVGKHKWAKMFATHKKQPVIVVADIWLPLPADKAISPGKNVKTGGKARGKGRGRGRGKVRGNGADDEPNGHVRRFIKVPVADGVEFEMWDITNMNSSETIGPNACNRWSFLQFLDNGAVPHPDTGIFPWRPVPSGVRFSYITYSWTGVDSFLQFIRHPARLMWDVSFGTSDEDMGHSILLGTNGQGANINALQSWIITENAADGSNILERHAPLVYGPALDHVKLLLCDGGPVLNKCVDNFIAAWGLGLGRCVKRNCTHHGINKRVTICKAGVGTDARKLLTSLQAAYNYIWHNAHTLADVLAALSSVGGFVQSFDVVQGEISSVDVQKILSGVVEPVARSASLLFPGACATEIMAGTLDKGMATSAVEGENSAIKAGNKANRAKSSVKCDSTTPIQRSAANSKCQCRSTHVPPLCSVFCALCSVLCVLCSVFCVLCAVICLLSSVFCLLSSVFCVLSSVCGLRSATGLLSTVFCPPSSVFCRTF